MVLPAKAGQSAVRASVVQSNRTRLLGRSTVGITFRAITPRAIGKPWYTFVYVIVTVVTLLICVVKYRATFVHVLSLHFVILLLQRLTR